MKLFAFFLLLIAASETLTALTDGEVDVFNITDAKAIPVCDDDYLNGGHRTETGSSLEVNYANLDAFVAQDGILSAERPNLPFPQFFKIGYGGLWKKGIQHWVAFPMLGVMACKQFVDLGRMSVGPKHGACQSSFKLASKWYQLNGCDPSTGMPKYLLDEDGVTIASCAAKNFKVICLKEGKIWGRGSCEGPPPDEPGSLKRWGDDVDENT